MDLREGIYLKLRNNSIEEEPARKAAPVAEYLYVVSRDDHFPCVHRQSQIWRGMMHKGIPFYYEDNGGASPFQDNGDFKRIFEELDCVGIGLEVLAHLKWVNTGDIFKASISAKGLEAIES